jgi:hypothetical protein
LNFWQWAGRDTDRDPWWVQLGAAICAVIAGSVIVWIMIAGW